MRIAEGERESRVEWEVRPYRPGDEERLVALYERVFGRPRPIDVWRWKLMGLQPSPDNVWVAETEDGRIVGQYGGIPLHIKLGEQTFPAVHAVEAMTSPDYRRQGMLTKLGSAAHDAWARSGNVMVIGLPNEQWGTRNYALGYRHVFSLGWLRYPLHLDLVARRPGKLPRSLAAPAAALGALGSGAWHRLFGEAMRRQVNGVNVSVEQVTTPSADLDRLWSTLSPRYENLVVRSSRWVGWRFINAAVFDYKVLLARIEGEPAGYIAYRLAESAERTNGYIADLFVAPDALPVTAALVAAALDDLSARGAGTVMATAPRDSVPRKHLKALGFLSGRSSTAFSFEMVSLHPAIDPAALADPRSWHLTAGDFDVI